MRSKSAQARRGPNSSHVFFLENGQTGVFFLLEANLFGVRKVLLERFKLGCSLGSTSRCQADISVVLGISFQSGNRFNSNKNRPKNPVTGWFGQQRSSSAAKLKISKSLEMFGWQILGCFLKASRNGKDILLEQGAPVNQNTGFLVSPQIMLCMCMVQETNESVWTLPIPKNEGQIWPFDTFWSWRLVWCCEYFIDHLNFQGSLRSPSIQGKSKGAQQF